MAVWKRGDVFAMTIVQQQRVDVRGYREVDKTKDEDICSITPLFLYTEDCGMLIAAAGLITRQQGSLSSVTERHQERSKGIMIAGGARHKTICRHA